MCREESGANENTDPGRCFSPQVSGGRTSAGAAREGGTGEEDRESCLGPRAQRERPRRQGRGWSSGKTHPGGGRAEGMDRPCPSLLPATQG